MSAQSTLAMVFITAQPTCISFFITYFFIYFTRMSVLPADRHHTWAWCHRGQRVLDPLELVVVVGCRMVAGN